MATDGQPSIDPPTAAMPPVGPNTDPAPSLSPFGSENPRATTQRSTDPRAVSKVRKQVQTVGIADTSGSPDSTLLREPVLVINRKGKLLELRAEYAIYDQDGTQIAAVRGKRVSSRLQVVDTKGRLLLDLRREASALNSKIVVARGDGSKLGRITPSVSLKQMDREFKLEGSNKELLGGVFREDRHRHREFNVQDAEGSVVADISKTRAGIVKELFSKGDHYVLSMPGPLSDTLRALAVAATLVIDTKFHQS